MIDRKFIGLCSGVRTVDVEKGQVTFFARTIGETNPIYYEDEAARAQGHPGIPVPPTFGFSLRLLAPEDEIDWGKLGVDIDRILHGEEQITYHGAIYVGDRLQMKATISDIYEKKNGALEFVVQDTVARNQNDDVVLEFRTVIVVRNHEVGGGA